MKKFTLFLAALLFFGLFSCGDQKSNESIADKPTTEKSPVSPDSAHQPAAAQESTTITQTDSMVTTAKDSTQNVAEKATPAQDSLLTAIQPKNAQDLFAPVPAELKDHIVYEELPTAEAIGIRPYPNAYVVKMNQKMEYKGKTYVTIELASPDAPEKVLDYYQKWKDDWFYMGGDGVYTFKQEKEKYFRETNTLQILTFNNDLHVEISRLLTFKPQTLIRIYYESK